MSISAQDVMALRERTGAGMMECKKALTETGGDTEKAVNYLRERGLAKAATKAGRATKEGLIYAYIHPGDKLGVLLEINCETDFVARTDEFKGLAKDIAMQVAAANPVAVRREDLDPAAVEAERKIFRQQVINEGKPEKIVDKIVEGKMEKYFGEVCLMEQAFVKQPELTINALVQGLISKLGENITVKRFVRYRLGE
ncbi:MAG TPA: translation elongation factor Ts [bacterium]|nr:translation elongation factor Ts [bacterium]